jgi:hypothetical protein
VFIVLKNIMIYLLNIQKKQNNMETDSFYNRGRSDCLQKLPANPTGAGVNNPQEHINYRDGYNFTREIVKIIN